MGDIEIGSGCKQEGPKGDSDNRLSCSQLRILLISLFFRDKEKLVSVQLQRYVISNMYVGYQAFIVRCEAKPAQLF